MKTWQTPQSDEGFELTPMIDVVFLLIAFFMTVSSIISAELIEIEMPVAEEASVPDEKGERQYITVDREGNLFLGAAPTDFDTITEYVRIGNETRPGFKVYLRADAETPHLHVRDVMSAIADGGVFDVIFATKQN